MKVRSFNEKIDKKILEESERESYSASFPGVLFPVEILTERVYAIAEGENTVFTLEDDLPVGCIICATDYFYTVPVGYIDSIYIRLEYRSKDGVMLLLDSANEHFRSLGIKHMRLDVTATNEQAVRAYEKYGFVVTRYQMDRPIKT